MVRSRRFIELIVEHDYAANTLERGEQMLAGLRRIAADTGAFGNVRGVGSLIAVDLETADLRNDSVSKLFEEHMMVLPCGIRSLRFRTPLNLEASDVDEILNRTERAMK
jgi:L-lysine 6-transaminase